MPLMNQRDEYGWLAITLHWLLFILVAGLVASGNYSDSLETKNPQIIGIHKQIGVAVFLLMAFRFLWKLINSSPAPLTEGGLLNFIASIVHFGLYVVVLGQALTGVMMTQLGGREVLFLGLEVPQLFGASGLLGDVPAFIADGDKSPGRLMREWHFYGGVAIGVLVGLHFLGAMFHQIQGDDTLRRMWYGYKPPYAKNASSTHAAVTTQGGKKS